MGRGNPNPVTKWKPGQSGNPAGQPARDNTWTGLIRKIGNEEVNGKTRKQRIVEYLYSYIEGQAGKAKKDDANIMAALKAISFLSDRDEGKPAQAIQMTGAEGNALKIEVEYKQSGEGGENRKT